MTRTFYLCLFAIVICSRISADDSFFIIAPDPKNRQVLSIAVDATEETTRVSQSDSLELFFGANGITTHPNSRYLIVTGGGDEATQAATVELGSAGKLRLVATSKLGGPLGYTSVDRSGRYLLSAHYGTGTVSVYGLNFDGAVSRLVDSFKTPNREAHCILTTRDNRFAYIPCVKNNNALFQYAFDETTGLLTPLDPFDAEPPAMFGPRHIAYHPTLPIAYFSNEQQLGVSVYSIGNDGQLNDIQHATTMPRRTPFEQGKRDLHASDIVIAPDGRFLFVAVRDFNGDEDSVFIFRVEPSGKLSLATRTRVGDIPWTIDISPRGQHLIVRESGDKRFSIWKVHSHGALAKAAMLDLPIGTNDFSVVGP